MTLSAQQLHRHSQSLFTQLHPTPAYPMLKNLLVGWKQGPRTAPLAIATFLKIARTIVQEAPDLLDDLNRCLLKDYPSSEHSPSLERVRQLAADNPHAHPILDSVLGWLRTEQQVVAGPPKAPQLEELSEQDFGSRLDRHRHGREVAKIIYLYRRCIITLAEFKKLIEPIYLSDPSFFNMLFQYAEELETTRRKVTIFAPLTELVDQKFPLEQVSNSYVFIPDGYANWSKQWARNPLENVFNRTYVSVPLGTEGSFVITRKNEYEEQLLRNQEDKYEIDSNLTCLRAALRIIKASCRLSHPLVQRILASIYPHEVLSAMLTAPSAEVAQQIVAPRLQQKLEEMQRCRSKFEKSCEEIAAKNFYKSLDYRCFYFCKNDKKFNSVGRWEREIELRREEVRAQCGEGKGSGRTIEDRQSMQHSRLHPLNSFDNITTHQLVATHTLPSLEPAPSPQVYPAHPHQQVLFLVELADQEVLHQALELILYHTHKKNTLELLVFKLFRYQIPKTLDKQLATLQFLEGKAYRASSKATPLNEASHNRRVYRDVVDEFLELIEEDPEPAKVESIPFCFEGPVGHTLIATKQCYLFLRYLLTIYQRLVRGKQLSEEREPKEGEPSPYQQLLAVLIHKLREQKTFEEYLRRVFQQDAFVFFTMDKLLTGVAKMINNIGPDSLTHRLLKEGVRDYQLEVRRWEDYPHPSLGEQLTRLQHEQDTLFRFTLHPSRSLILVSAWENPPKKPELSQGHINSPVIQKLSGGKLQSRRQDKAEYSMDEQGVLQMQGQEAGGRTCKRASSLRWEEEVKRCAKHLKMI